VRMLPIAYAVGFILVSAQALVLWANSGEPSWEQARRINSGLVLVAALIVGGAGALLARSLVRRWLGKTEANASFDRIVRCSRGHLFTTIRIPGVSLKAARWGGRRNQRCACGR